MSNLSVLHINVADNLSGSARSAYKIHCGLRELGVDSKMLVGIKVTSDPDVDIISRRWRKAVDQIICFGMDILGLQYLYVPSSWGILRHPWFKEADIVQLYVTHSNYFSHRILPEISKRKKVVWRFSDMWAMTGHCAYSGFCEKWKTGCRNCPDLSSFPSLSHDTTSMLWRWKRCLYKKSNIHIIAPCSWMKQIAEESPLLNGFSKSVIPNGVNVDIFKPLSQELCRKILNIPKNKKAVLFLAHFLKDSRKGGDFFINAINSLCNSERDDLMVMLVGYGAHNWGNNLHCPVWRHDFVREDELLALIYNAADVLVHPATRENLPNSVLEAMGCGLPPIAFDTGGVKEVVKHKQTGYLARFEAVQDLAEGISWLMESSQKRDKIARNCRKLILENFTVERQAKDFLDLYRTFTLPKESN